MQELVLQTQLTSLEKIYSGKVRDIYQVDEQHILICATDRVSAFDVVLPNGIPKKGIILTQIANFWFDLTEDSIRNHRSSLTLNDLNLSDEERDQLEYRSVIVKQQTALPVEAIVRGYLLGSGWKDYQHSGSICGIDLPQGLKQASKLPKTLFTPSTKAAVGDHDINIDFASMVDLIGQQQANQIKDLSIHLYEQAAAYAKARGVIIADTKFEFGIDESGELCLIDEILTPDSSRFWAEEHYQEGISPPSFDKQIVRDYLETLDWNKQAPGPSLPQAVIDDTRSQYEEVAKRLAVQIP